MAPILPREISNIRYSNSNKSLTSQLYFSLRYFDGFYLKPSKLQLPLPEPPDIGKWFSSYEYNTPGPDSNVNLEDSAPKGCGFIKHEKREGEEVNFKKLVAAEKLSESNTCFEQDTHEDRFMVKGVDSFSSHSLLSEPPDIRNWLPSYVYESFEPDTISLFGDSATKERESEEEGFIFEEKIGDEVRCEAIQPSGPLEHNSSYPKKDRKVSQPSNRVEEKILQPCLHGTTLQLENCPTKWKCEETCQNHANLDCNKESTFMSVDINTGCSDYNSRFPQSVHMEHIRETRSKAKIQVDKLDTGVSFVDRFSRDKENEDVKFRNDFVSTRKNRSYLTNDENSFKRSQEMLSEDSSNSGTVSSASEKHAVPKRKALAEAINYQQSNAIEITGKWQCPQKSKPNVGPTLKQLRLEQWLRRA